MCYIFFKFWRFPLGNIHVFYNFVFTYLAYLTYPKFRKKNKESARKEREKTTVPKLVHIVEGIGEKLAKSITEQRLKIYY